MYARNPLKYLIKQANTERYKKSSIPYLQGLLNKDYAKRKAEFNELLNFKHAVKRRKTLIDDKNRPPMQVNYVGYANSITQENKVYYYYYYYICRLSTRECFCYV